MPPYISLSSFGGEGWGEEAPFSRAAFVSRFLFPERVQSMGVTLRRVLQNECKEKRCNQLRAVIEVCHIKSLRAAENEKVRSRTNRTGGLDKDDIVPRVYIDRVAGSDSYHRNPREPFAARPKPGKRSGEGHVMS